MAWPTSPQFMAVNFENKEYNVYAESVTGRPQARGLGGQKWMFSAQYNNMTEASMLPIMAYSTALRGSRTTTTVVLPELSDQSSGVSGTLTVSGSHSIGDDTISVTGTSGIHKAGKFVKFAGHSKVYMITADLSGSGTLNIVPPITNSLAGSEGVTYDAVPFTVRLVPGTYKINLGLPNIYTYQVDFMEEI